jgi:hypothetical protein
VCLQRHPEHFLQYLAIKLQGSAETLRSVGRGMSFQISVGSG